MRSLAAAAALLERAATIDDQASLARLAGFTRPSLELDDDTCQALAIEALVRDARVLEGAGTLRALVARVRPGCQLRHAIVELAARLTTRAPHLLWLLVLSDATGAELALAAWSPERSRPRVASLLVERRHVAPSDAETLCAIEGAANGPDLLVHARWLEILGREALTRRFYRALEGVVETLALAAESNAELEERREIALLYVSRLLFISFLETKGWMNGDRGFLARWYAEIVGTGRSFQHRVLLPLFFGTLNTPLRMRASAARAFGRVPFLNGGLFARTPLERRLRALRFSDEALGRVFDQLLARYRFTAREASDRWSEAAIDPEMLGKAFESLMASRERRASGAFYTPHQLVDATTTAALARALGAPPLGAELVEHVLHGGAPDETAARVLRERVRELRVLDPACGSGAFLVHALDSLAALLARAGDSRPAVALRRDLLTRSIFGVDINPTAVWLCELRLWLSVVIESADDDPMAVEPLPNLDRHVRVGDALAGDTFETEPRSRSGSRIAHLRARYARASGARKRTLERTLARAERAWALGELERRLAARAATRRDLVMAARERDLFGGRQPPGRELTLALAAVRADVRAIRRERERVSAGGALPFSFPTHFPDIATRGGFDLIIGNPPWVRLHRIPPRARTELRERFTVFRAASWMRGATMAGAGSGFASQVDLAALFTERALRLLRPGALLALLLPAKLWRSIAGGGVRHLLRSEGHVLVLEDWSESPPAFDAAVYPSMVVARRAILENGRRASRGGCIGAALHRRAGAVRWEIAPERLGLDHDAASPWLVLPPDVRAAFDRLTHVGPALAESPLGRPVLGVKCGCNDAFLVRVHGGDDVLARVRAGARIGVVERALLRPVVRGETIGAGDETPEREMLIWTHGADGRPLPHLPPHAARWLAPHRARLAARADARRTRRWWSLFRLHGAAHDRARVVWADVARSPRAMVLPPGDDTVALNSCYVLPCATLEDARAFAALLSSPLAAAWLNALAEPARGGYRRYLAWTVALLPVPDDWPRARTLLAGCLTSEGDAAAGDPRLLSAVLRAYRLRHVDLAPLLAWNAR